MKVVILAGGLGSRISEESHLRPKPMIEIGGMPILWHIMKLYSHYEVNEFIICAGYKQHVIKEWFADYFLHTSDITFDFTQDDKIIVHNKRAEKWKVVIDNINGKEAITHFEVLKRYKKYTLIKCRLETGRTHQIRVHMSSINHPLVGDKIYGGSTSLYNEGQLLHAYNLTFIQPSTKKEVNVQIDLPQYFIDVLNKLEN